MKKKKSISYAKWGYIFILPFFITFLIFSLIPLVDTVRYSFYEYYRSGIKEIGPNFIGIANYLSLLKSDMLKYSTNTLNRFPGFCNRNQISGRIYELPDVVW